MEKLLEIKSLKEYFPVKAGFFGKTVNYVKAVDDISFDIYKGETLGLVGESGCGKSTTGRMIVNLLKPTDGEVIFQGKNISKLKKSEQRKYCKDIQIIFQDPYASLNPRMTIGDIIKEPMKVNKTIDKSQMDKKAVELLNHVGLASYHKNRFPHEFSGGQRQRIGIARALSLQPKLIVCDEPVSALDVSIQAQVLNLLHDLQEEFHLTYLFIAHGLNVVKHVSSRVGVMYLGKIVEMSDKNSLYEDPKHPYTKALISAIPIPDPTRKKERIILQGDVPSPLNPPQGCRFHTRCPKCMEICKQKEPNMIKISEGHSVACHLYTSEQK